MSYNYHVYYSITYMIATFNVIYNTDWVALSYMLQQTSCCLRKGLVGYQSVNICQHLSMSRTFFPSATSAEARDDWANNETTSNDTNAKHN